MNEPTHTNPYVTVFLSSAHTMNIYTIQAKNCNRKELKKKKKKVDLQICKDSK